MGEYCYKNSNAGCYPYKITTCIEYNQYIFSGSTVQRWLHSTVGLPYTNWVSLVDYATGRLVIAVKSPEHAAIVALAWT